MRKALTIVMILVALVMTVPTHAATSATVAECDAPSYSNWASHYCLQMLIADILYGGGGWNDGGDADGVGG